MVGVWFVGPGCGVSARLEHVLDFVLSECGYLGRTGPIYGDGMRHVDGDELARDRPGPEGREAGVDVLNSLGG